MIVTGSAVAAADTISAPWTPTSSGPPPDANGSGSDTKNLDVGEISDVSSQKTSQEKSTKYKVSRCTRTDTHTHTHRNSPLDRNDIYLPRDQMKLFLSLHDRGTISPRNRRETRNRDIRSLRSWPERVLSCSGIACQPIL